MSENKEKIPRLVERDEQTNVKETTAKYNYQKIRENLQQESNEQLNDAPNRFPPRELKEYECNACKADVLLEETVCPNCGADISEVDKSDEPEPTVNVVGDEQSKQPIKSNEKPVESPRNLVAIGMVIAIVGIGLIVISPNLDPGRTVYKDMNQKGSGLWNPLRVESHQTANQQEGAMIFGVSALVLGGILSALGFSKMNASQPTTPPVPPTQPVVTHAVSPKTVELGNNPDEVQSVMGPPDKIIDLGARVIHVYKDMKIIYDDGKVSDVQIS